MPRTAIVKSTKTLKISQPTNKMSTRAKLKRLASEAYEDHIQKQFEIDSIDIKIEEPDEHDYNSFEKFEEDTDGVKDVPTVSRPFPCTFCDKRFARKYSRKLHENTHTLGWKPFACKICDKQFARSNRLRQHENTHKQANTRKVCNQTLAKNKRLKIHEETHTRNEPFPCCFCEFSCSSETDLIIHERIHTGEKPFTCDYCAERFATLSQKVFHERTHSGERILTIDRVYVCNTCGKTSNDQKRTLNPLNTNTLSSHNTEVYTKEICAEKPMHTLDATCPRKEEEDVQIGTVEEYPVEQISEVYITEGIQHSEEMEKYDRLSQMKTIKTEELPEDIRIAETSTELILAGSRLRSLNIDDLVRDISGVENMPPAESSSELNHTAKERLACPPLPKFKPPPKVKTKKTFSCKFCDRKVDIPSKLKLHESACQLKLYKQTHTSGKPFICDYCSKSFVKKYSLQIHMLGHMDTDRITCKYCPKTFIAESFLKMHEKIHTMEKSFLCAYCDHRCLNKAALQIHERIHTGEKPFKCQHCPKKFTQIGYRKMHERIHSGEKPYQCKYCDKSFREKGGLILHERTHTGEKPFKCRFCVKQCADKNAMKEHERIHTGERPYACRICGQRFRQGSTRRTHEKTCTRLIKDSDALVKSSSTSKS